MREAAIFYGTPNSSSAKLESGLTTLLAEKSTLFPIKFCLNRPSLPFNRSAILFTVLIAFCLLIVDADFYNLVLSNLIITAAIFLSSSSILLAF